MSNKAFDQTLFEQLLKRIAEGESVETDQLPEQFLAAPEVQALLKLSRVASRLDHNVAGDSPRPQADLRGARLGGYRLTRLLGAGGMGQVWLAERDDHSIEHAVAIKRLSIDHTSSPAGRHFAARLREERRILARLDHPNIARFVDAGLAEDGTPWFAMEYVDGVSLNEWCEQTQPSLRARLELFKKICAAVQHAHRELVVHRDLKPGNVMVSKVGEPKLLDFGIAKLLDGGSPETTAAGLTPAFAAPEQLRGEPVSTSADIYALGLILYRMLSGTLPASRMQASALAVLSELDRATSEKLSDAAKRSAPMLPYPTQQLSGDLDAILSKALRMEVSARYGTVAEFSDDIDRYLEARPVRARAPHAWYHFSRFLRRQRLPLALSALAMLALLVGTWVALVQAERAGAEATRARAEAKRSELIKEFVLSVFQEQDPITRAHAQSEPAAIIEEGLERAESELGADPSLKIEVIRDLSVIESALGRTESALARLESLVQQDHAFAPLARARNRAALGQVLMTSGKLEEAERWVKEALEGLVMAGVAEPERQKTEFLMARIMVNTGRSAEALALAQGIHKRTVELKGAEHADSIAQLIFVGSAGTAAGQFDAAETSFREALRLIESVRGTQHASLGFVYSQLGNVYRRLARYQDAIKAFARADEIMLPKLGQEHPLRVSHMLRFADTLRRAGDLDAASAKLKAAKELLKFDSPENAQWHMFQGQLEASRANYLAAAEQFQLSYRGFLGTAGEKSASTWGALGEQGRMLLLAQRFDQAEEVIRRVYEARRAIFPPGSMDVALSEWQLGNVLRARGKAEQALVFHERALTSLSKALPAEHPQISGITSEIVRDLMVLPEQASKLRARTMVEAWVKQKPASLESSEQHAVWVELAAQTGAEDARQALLALELAREPASKQ